MYNFSTLSSLNFVKNRKREEFSKTRPETQKNEFTKQKIRRGKNWKREKSLKNENRVAEYRP